MGAELEESSRKLSIFSVVSHRTSISLQSRDECLLKKLINSFTHMSCSDFGGSHHIPIVVQHIDAFRQLVVSHQTHVTDVCTGWAKRRRKFIKVTHHKLLWLYKITWNMKFLIETKILWYQWHVAPPATRGPRNDTCSVTGTWGPHLQRGKGRVSVWSSWWQDSACWLSESTRSAPPADTNNHTTGHLMKSLSPLYSADAEAAYDLLYCHLQLSIGNYRKKTRSMYI